MASQDGRLRPDSLDSLALVERGDEHTLTSGGIGAFDGCSLGSVAFVRWLPADAARRDRRPRPAKIVALLSARRAAVLAWSCRIHRLVEASVIFVDLAFRERLEAATHGVSQAATIFGLIPATPVVLIGGRSVEDLGARRAPHHPAPGPVRRTCSGGRSRGASSKGSDVMVGKGPRAWLPPRWFVRGFWKVHRAWFRITRGRRGLWPATADRWGAMRLSVVGRRTGRQRSVILGYFEDGHDLVTLAMNGWGPEEPAWWLNLQAHPQAQVQLSDGSVRHVLARAAVGEERARRAMRSPGATTETVGNWPREPVAG